MLELLEQRPTHEDDDPHAEHEDKHADDGMNLTAICAVALLARHLRPKPSHLPPTTCQTPSPR